MNRRQQVAAHIWAHPFTCCLALGAVAAAVVLAVDQRAFETISILQVSNETIGAIWLVLCAAAGVVTLAGIGLLRADVEALGLVLLGTTLAVQGLGTALRFGVRSIFPILVFGACAAACLSRVAVVIRVLRVAHRADEQ